MSPAVIPSPAAGAHWRDRRHRPYAGVHPCIRGRRQRQARHGWADRTPLPHNPVKFANLAFEVMRQVFETLLRMVRPGTRACSHQAVAFSSTHRFRDRRREGHLASTRCVTPKLDPLLGSLFLRRTFETPLPGKMQNWKCFRRGSRMWSIPRQRSASLGHGRFGRMRTPPWRRWSSPHPGG